jgi:hypothetical protein
LASPAALPARQQPQGLMSGRLATCHTLNNQTHLDLPKLCRILACNLLLHDHRLHLEIEREDMRNEVDIYIYILVRPLVNTYIN